MNRRNFVKNASSTVVGIGAGVAAGSLPRAASGNSNPPARPPDARALVKPKDYKKEPFQRLVILGESTVEGGPWLHEREQRYADVLVRHINTVQEKPLEYFNKGIGNNSISPRSPAYAQSAKPSAIE